MDSGLGSDEDRKGRTKEQKQLRNQQLLSGCFIDAASLSDDADVVAEQPPPGNQRRCNEERRQGALIFQSSIPQFSMLQMTAAASAPNVAYPETPYNSIVHLDTTNGQDDAGSGASSTKSPMGFYVDLSDMPDQPKTPPTSKKNIFSMVIDFEGPKKEKPSKLSSSLITYKKSKQTKQLSLTSRVGGGSSSLSSSVSSISSVAGPSNRQQDDEKEDSGEGDVQNNGFKSSSSSENVSLQKGHDVDVFVKPDHEVECKGDTGNAHITNGHNDNVQEHGEAEKKENAQVNDQPRDQHNINTRIKTSTKT